MKKPKTGSLLFIASALLLVLALGVTAVVAEGESSNSNESTVSESAASDSGSTTSPALDGAKVYAWNCGACHSERWPRERNDADWDVIMMHMRVRANLTANQTDAVLGYLKENN